MQTLTTKGIKISVQSSYQAQHSHPSQQKYVFTYNITIENTNPYPVKLLSRHWHITDSGGLSREVEGRGVIGQQPTISPDSQHQYTSWAPIHTSIGKMRGTYLMINPSTGEKFHVRIPSFLLIAKHILN